MTQLQDNSLFSFEDFLRALGVVGSAVDSFGAVSMLDVLELVVGVDGLGLLDDGVPLEGLFLLFIGDGTELSGESAVLALDRSLFGTEGLCLGDIFLESVDGKLSSPSLTFGLSEIILGEVSVLNVSGNFSVPVLDDLDFVLLGGIDSTFSKA